MYIARNINYFSYLANLSIVYMDGSGNLSKNKSLRENFNLLSKIDKSIVKAMNGGATPMSSFKDSDTTEQITNTIHEEEYLKSCDYIRSLMFHYQLISEEFHNKNKDVKQCI